MTNIPRKDCYDIRYTTWRDDEIELLSILWVENKLNVEEIGVELNNKFGTNRSKNAIISKIHRSGIIDYVRKERT